MATKTKKKTYLAHGANFVCVIRARDVRRDNFNNPKVFDEGLKIEFKDHPGGFETDDPEIQAALEASPGFNDDFHCVGEEPGALHPTFAEVSEAIADAFYNADVDSLGELLNEERETHGRAEILTALTNAVDTLRTKIAEDTASESPDLSPGSPDTPADPDAQKAPAKPPTKKPAAKRKPAAKKPAASKASAKK